MFDSWTSRKQLFMGMLLFPILDLLINNGINLLMPAVSPANKFVALLLTFFSIFRFWIEFGIFIFLIRNYLKSCFINLKNIKSWLMTLLCVVLAVLYNILISTLHISITSAQHSTENSVSAATSHISLLILLTVTIILVSPILEEIIFQYFFQKIFFPIILKKLNVRHIKLYSLLASTLLFIGSHIVIGNVTIKTILTGLIVYSPLLLLGILYEKTNKNIIYPIVAHIIINFLGMISIS